MMTTQSSKKPTILERCNDSVKISWSEIFPQNGDDIYELELYDELAGWRLIYWGRKTEFKIINLEHCTCYTMRLRKRQDIDWLTFKVATDYGELLATHVSRALKYDKMPLLRKIANTKPALLDTENKESKTPLMQTAESGDVSMTLALLNFGANVNITSIFSKRSPLMLAIYFGRLEIAKLLIDRGADLKAFDINKFTILHFAVDSNKIDSVNFVLSYDVDVNLKDSAGFTPLIRAVIMNRNVDIITALFGRGADSEIKDKSGFDFRKHCELVGEDHLIDLIPRKVEISETEDDAENNENPTIVEIKGNTEPK